MTLKLVLDLENSGAINKHWKIRGESKLEGKLVKIVLKWRKYIQKREIYQEGRNMEQIQGKSQN